MRSKARAKRPRRDRRVLTILGDVRSNADVARTVEAAIKRFARIDVLVNNAGDGAAICTHIVLRQMETQGYGRVDK